MSKPVTGDTGQVARRKRKRFGCLAVILVAVLVVMLPVGVLVVRILEDPKITRNYAVEYNSQMVGVPEYDKGWPIYREAILAASDHPIPDSIAANWPKTATWSNWSDAVLWVEQMQQPLSLVREASKRPILGLPLSDATDPDLNQANFQVWYKHEPATPPSANPLLFGASLAHLSMIREMTKALKLESIVFLEQGDSDRAIENCEALLRMSVQINQLDMFSEQLFQIALDSAASRSLLFSIQTYPDQFDEGQLSRLQETFTVHGQLDSTATQGIARFVATFDTELVILEDILQRAYSDDGQGDGHLTIEGAQVFQDLGSTSRLVAIFGPKSRRRIISDFESAVPFLNENAARHPWNRPDSFQTSVDALNSNHSIMAVVPGILRIETFTPGWYKAIAAADQLNAEHDATIAVIALYRHRLKYDTFPDALGDLVPEFLPYLPLDPINGQPMRYKVVNSNPVLYSISADHIDNGGTRNEDGGDVYPGAPPNRKGDWVIFPLKTPVDWFADETP